MTIAFIKGWNSYEAGESVALAAEIEAELVAQGLAIKMETVVRGIGAAVASVATATPAAAPAGGVGTAAGGWDTAANRDAAIATINSTRILADELKTQVNALLAELRTRNIIGQ